MPLISMTTEENVDQYSQETRRTSRRNSNYRLNHAMIANLYRLSLCTLFPRNFLLSRDFFGASCTTFLIIAPYKYSYLLTH